MGKPVVYHSGLDLQGVYCSRCRRHTDGFVMQNRMRWVIYAKCGHLVMRGSVLPPEVLESQKLINQKQPEDPRAQWMQKHEEGTKRTKQIEEIAHEMGKLERTRGRFL